MAGAVARAIENFPDSDFEHLFASMHIAASGALNDDERFLAVLRATEMRGRDDRLMRAGPGRHAAIVRLLARSSVVFDDEVA